MALAPVLIFALVLVAVFGAAIITTLDHNRPAVVAGDSAPPGTTGLARPHPKSDVR
jgi:hypothetical protein